MLSLNEIEDVKIGEKDTIFFHDGRGKGVHVYIINDSHYSPKASHWTENEIVFDDICVGVLGEHPIGGGLNRGHILKGYEDRLKTEVLNHGSLEAFFKSLPMAFSGFTGYIPFEGRKKQF